MAFRYFLPVITINTLAITFQLDKLIKIQQDINNKVNKDTNKVNKDTNKVNKDTNKSPIVEVCNSNSHVIYGEECLCGEIK